jgi:SAM-dependent methyltransferase
VSTAAPDYKAITERQQGVWSQGDFGRVGVILVLHGELLAESVDIHPGERVLDVGGGTGTMSLAAARRFATVMCTDFVPELLAQAKQRADAERLSIETQVADAQNLPFEDGSFDVVVSTFGCMFAPDHRRTAGEIARVLAPGGRFGVVAWRPEGNIGRFFMTISKYAPPPPEGFQPPPLWGVRDHVTEIFDGTGAELRFEDGAAHWHFDSFEQTVEEYSSKFGPIVTLRPQLEADGRWEDLVADLDAMYREVAVPEGDGIAFDGEFLTTLGAQA